MGKLVALAVTFSSLMSVLSACVSTPATDSSDADLDVSLCDAINTYRIDHGLPAIPVSAALMTVARYHAEDLASNGTGGTSCNLHSWTSSDMWSGCCYTDDNAQAACMWNKPREIASYAAPGVEIAARAHAASITPATAVAAWDASEHHREVIANDDDFSDSTWRAMGCAIESGYATVWFGELAAH